ncbi:MAG: C40 family peptidase [Bacteroidota bacterium]
MFGICLLPLIPLREQPTSKSEMVSQVLFGEKFKVLHQQTNWIKIETFDDHYTGWISEGQYDAISEQELHSLTNVSIVKSYPQLSVQINGTNMLVPAGSCIYGHQSFTIANQHFQLDYKETSLPFIDIAKQFLNTTYLWGGRTAWGIDCSGFTQNVFKQYGFVLKRDAYQQAEQGQTLAFLSEARLGDLAFFDNEEGRITHVGILLDNETIIHASGKVRIDKIDNFGIINNESKKYSHKLRLIKRIMEVL